MSDKKKKPAEKNKSKSNKASEPKAKASSKLIAKIKKQQEDQKYAEEELKRQEEEEERKLQLLKEKEENEKRMKELKKEKLKQKKKEKKEREKQEGIYLTEKERKKLREKRVKLNVITPTVGDDEKPKVVYDKMKKKQNKVNKEDLDENNEKEPNENQESYSKDDSSESELQDWEDMLEVDNEVESNIVLEEKPIVNVQKEVEIPDDPIEAVKMRLAMRHKEYEAKRSNNVLRAPIVCVLGHVDTGKTKLLDKLRHTDVQGGETGGITQQIGATNVPIDHISSVKKLLPDLKLPGLLIIDTPGHESFSNMRNRGSSLCDLAILVIDIMHGVEAQTKESVRILLKRKVPFVVALNKIDRLVEWKSQSNKDIRSVLESQSVNNKDQFNDRYKVAIQHFAELGLNLRFFWEEDDQSDYISVVPTSAHTGDGMDDLIGYLCNYAQNHLATKISYTEELQATVMEVKETPGHGTTLDVILVNGCLKANDNIVLGGQEGPIQTKVRYLLRPAPMAELRVKGEYHHLQECKAAQGVKLVAKDIDKAMAGMPIYRIQNEDEVVYYKQELTRYIDQAISSIRLSDVGVYVQTSTLGSLEALLEFLKQQNVPYSGINIGTIHKKDVIRAAIMREKDPKWAVILAFNVRVEPEADTLARELGVRVFRQEIIYRLHDDMTQYLEEMERELKERIKDRVIFPVKLKIFPDKIFQRRNPILVGVHIERGVIRLGTPIMAVTAGNQIVDLGKAVSIEQNNRPVSEGRAGDTVAICISPVPGEPPRMVGRHFLDTDTLYSKINRDSIDLLKNHYRSEMEKDDWKLIKEIKPILGII